MIFRYLDKISIIFTGMLGLGLGMSYLGCKIYDRICCKVQSDTTKVAIGITIVSYTLIGGLIYHSIGIQKETTGKEPT